MIWIRNIGRIIYNVFMRLLNNSYAIYINQRLSKGELKPTPLFRVLASIQEVSLYLYNLYTSIQLKVICTNLHSTIVQFKATPSTEFGVHDCA